jgi:hypothetical protein
MFFAMAFGYGLPGKSLLEIRHIKNWAKASSYCFYKPLAEAKRQ